MRSWKAIAGTIFDPVGTFRALADAPKSLLVLLLVAAAHLAVPVALSSKLTTRTQVLAELGPKLSEMSDRDVDEAVEQKSKLVEVALVAKGLVGPPLLALELCIVLWLWGRYLRAKPPFASLFSLCAHAQIPLGLRSLAEALVVTGRKDVTPDELTHLLPSGLSSVLSAHGAWAHVLGGADLFLVWTGVLLGIALFVAGKMPARRAAIGMGLAYAAFVAVFLVGLPGLGGA